MDFTILADPKFGWIFVISEILILYIIFLFVHRIVENKIKRK